MVKHTYIFTNAGGAMLAGQQRAGILRLHNSDGSRQVSPGKTGNIPMQFNSASFNGQVGKAITVTCNDTNQPTVVLQMKGTIWKPVDITPKFAVLELRTANGLDQHNGAHPE